MTQTSTGEWEQIGLAPLSQLSGSKVTSTFGPGCINFTDTQPDQTVKASMLYPILKHLSTSI